MFDLTRVQSELAAQGMDGWLLYDFRGLNIPARRILHLPDGTMGSRRWLYWIPQSGEPHKIVHRIEDGILDHLPGGRTVYLKWEELEAAIGAAVRGRPAVAMEYSPRNGNPYVSRVDAGTVELVRSFGPKVVSSGDLVQQFEATWDDEQERMHFAAAKVTDAAYGVAWRLIADQVKSSGGIEEQAVSDAIMRHFADQGCTTYHAPIVARGAHAGSPHYETGAGSDTRIRKHDLVLIDLWCKLNEPRAVYSDLTRMGFAGSTVPVEYAAAFATVAAARDAAIDCVRGAFAARRPLAGWEVDDAARKVIDAAGHGKAFCHRTGHNIGQEVHGNGANMDNLETHEERRVLPRTCFSVEPGIYTPEFGVRSETNVYIDGQGTVHVTGGPLQTRIETLL